MTPRGRMQARVLRWTGRALARLPARAVPRLGAGLSRCGPLVRRRARIAARNLALAFPGLDVASRNRLLRETLASNSTGGLDALRAWFAPSAALRGLGDITGLDTLVVALAEGHGAVLVGAHYDSLELAIRLVADAARERGARTAIFLRHYADPVVDAAIEAGRLRYAVATIDKKDVSGFCGAVAGGGAVVYAADQDAGPDGVFVPFFGVPAATTRAMAGVLSRAGGVPLLMWSKRDHGGRLAVDIARAPEGFFAGDGADVAARYMAWVEQRVREAPAQYLWVHRRYKTRPPGSPPVYGDVPSA